MSIQKLRGFMTVVGLFIFLPLSNAAGAVQFDAVLRIGWGADAVGLDPVLQGDKQSVSVTFHIHDTLIQLDPKDFSPRPMLAERWEAKDETTYRFYLRKGVTFHDGTPLNAEAVKYSLERYVAKETASPRAMYLESMKEIKVIDDHTLEVKLKYPFGPFLQHIAYQSAGIVSPKAAKEYGLDKYTLHPIGTGPYKFKEWKKGEEIVLERNERYWGGRPKLKEIRFKVIQEDSTRMIALETGEIDIATQVPPHDADRLKGLRGIKVVSVPTPRTIYIALNTKVKPFDDVRVRKAIYYATDIRGMVRALFGEYAKFPNGVMVSFLFGGKEQAVEYDLQKTKRLMAEAGYPKGFPVELCTPVGRYPMDKEAATLFANQIEKNIGIKVSLKLFEWAAFYSKLRSRTYSMALMGFGNVTGDADMFLYPQFHSSSNTGTFNLANYSNPEVDKLLDLARRSPDQEARRKSYHKVLDIVLEECPWIPLYNSVEIFGLRDYVKGFNSRMELVLVDTVYIDK